jgi:two-component system, OmpR family, sensor histidine kinase TctE
MPRANEPSLRRSLIIWLLGPLLVLLLLDTLLTSSTSVKISHQAHDRSLHDMAREIFLHVRQNNGTLHLDMSPAVERILLADQDDTVHYKVWTGSGVALGGDPDIRFPGDVRLAAHQPAFHDDTLHGLSVRMVTVAMPLEERPGADAVVIRVAETLHKRNRLAREILFSVFAPQLLLILFATGAVYYGVGRGLQPLQTLRRAVSSRSHLDLSPIEVNKVPGEVRPLVEEINSLLARLHNTFDFQSRFIADAAHQLKTPVAGIKAQIELALRETGYERMQHSFAHLYVSADRLSRLVGQLLSLARNEPGAAQNLDFRPLDLKALALEVTMNWVPEALKRNIDLGFEGPDDTVIIDGDPHRLREMINNLIDNAVRYSQDNGRVTVRVGGEGRPQLSVSDDGPHIPVEERKRIFQRFHRLLGTQTDGSGLGLAIVSEIAALHEATITLDEDLDGIGNTFTVHFSVPQNPSVSLA